MSRTKNTTSYFTKPIKGSSQLSADAHRVLLAEGLIATGGGEGDAHELCLEIFSKNLEKPKRRKDSSLSASIESLELDADDHIDNVDNAVDSDNNNVVGSNNNM